MKSRFKERQSILRVKNVIILHRLFKRHTIGALILMLILTVNVLPAGAVSIPNNAPEIQAPSTLTFTAEADARVEEANRNSNFGTSSYLFVDGTSNPRTESFIRFTVSGVTGTIQSAQLRVFVTSNSSNNSPALYGANNSWTESAITWNNRPERTSGILDNKGSSQTNSWLDYNVSAAVSGNGTYTFVLAADSADGIRFSAREGSQPPQLVITLSGGSTATQPPAATASSTATQTSTATSTGIPLPTASRTATPTGSQVPAATNTSGSGNTLLFAANADARVAQASPSTNYGTATTLQADGNAGSVQTSYLRFTTGGISGAIQSVKLRIFCTTNGTENGPAVHLANNNWIESGSGGMNWNNRPALAGGAVDNKATIATNSWVEYDVTSLVTGNATYTFALVADSTDGVVFSAREGAQPPQLVVTLGAGNPPSTNTPVTPQSSSPTPVTRLFTFTPSADSYVDANNSSMNYGSQTQLRGDGSPVIRSYLRFVVQGLNGPVVRATLRIFANSGSTSGYDIRSVTNNTWAESTITYNNAPAVGGILGSSGGFNSGTWTTVNITPYITGNGTYNVALTVPGSTGLSFASREVGNSAPQLVVEAQGGVGPAFTVTPVNTGTPTATQTSTPLPTFTATRTPTSAATSSGSVVLVGAGDITSCSRSQDELTAQLLDSIPGTVFTAGDNAYVDGSYTDYLNCYEPTWGRHKSRTKPSPGNHDYHTSGAAGYFQYFNNVPSYYAYDLGAWRIYSLNSEISATATSAQAIWLQDDLAANPSQCVLAYWHKARWSSGSNHGNNSAMGTLWQILYNAGAEIVLNGHEHQYERFAQMDATGAAVTDGLREFVVGTGGAGLYPFGTALAASQVRNNTTYGVLKLTLHPTSYDWQFVPVAGSTFTDSGSSNCH